MRPRPGPPLRRDFRMMGCAWCQDPKSIGDAPNLPMRIVAPYASLDARDDVRMHGDCHRIFVYAIWGILGFAPIPEFFL